MLGLCSSRRPARQRLNCRRAHHGAAIILAGKVIPPNTHHLLKHARAIDQWINSGPADMPPPHCNFLHAKPKFARQKKNLRIEAPALDALQRQNLLRSPPRESFKSALRVLEPQPQNNPVQSVEDSPKQLPMQRLPLLP